MWLSVEQGGRTELPQPGAGQDYAVMAFVPPGAVQTGAASFVVRAAAWGSAVSAAEGGWLVFQPDERFHVAVGSVLVVVEGVRVVGYFHVEEVVPAVG